MTLVSDWFVESDNINVHGDWARKAGLAHSPKLMCCYRNPYEIKMTRRDSLSGYECFYLGITCKVAVITNKWIDQ